MSKYTELITNYHATKPKFLAHVDLMTRPLIDVAAATRGLITAFDIDSAVGVQLDILGLWIGRISDVSRELIAAIKQGYLTVKAAGVWAGGIETPSVETPSEGSKFFGFDMDNEFISGFDVGAWGVLL
ncbi:DUF2612 domain-containing protein [Escherichia coli]|nr:DUF2612 domain-containing protein [Escherichia coli]